MKRIAALIAITALSACSGSEKEIAQRPTAEAAAPPAAEASPPQPQPPPPPASAAPSFDRPNRPAIPITAELPGSEVRSTVQPELSSFRVPTDAIGGSNLDTSIAGIAHRGEAALRKHFGDLGVDTQSFYFKFPVEQRDGYWTMTFYGNPTIQPDGIYVEVRVFPDGGAEIRR